MLMILVFFFFLIPSEALFHAGHCVASRRPDWMCTYMKLNHREYESEDAFRKVEDNLRRSYMILSRHSIDNVSFVLSDERFVPNHHLRKPYRLGSSKGLSSVHRLMSLRRNRGRFDWRRYRGCNAIKNQGVWILLYLCRLCRLEILANRRRHRDIPCRLKFFWIVLCVLWVKITDVKAGGSKKSLIMPRVMRSVHGYRFRTRRSIHLVRQHLYHPKFKCFHIADCRRLRCTRRKTFGVHCTTLRSRCRRYRCRNHRIALLLQWWHIPRRRMRQKHRPRRHHHGAAEILDHQKFMGKEMGRQGYLYLERGVNACGVANYQLYHKRKTFKK